VVILLMRSGCMNEKNMRVRRGSMAAMNGPNIVPEITQTKVCFWGYSLPEMNVSH